MILELSRRQPADPLQFMCHFLQEQRQKTTPEQAQPKDVSKHDAAGVLDNGHESDKSVVSIVAGCSGKLGQMVSEHLRRCGHTVIGMDRQGGCLDVDCTKDDAVEQAMKEALRMAGSSAKECYLINALGYSDSVDEMRDCSHFEDVPISAFQGHLDMNLRAVFLLMQAFVRNFSSRAKCIVNFSSMYATLCPKPSMYKSGLKNPGYPASKRGVEALSEYAAVLLGPTTRVVCLAPGGVKETIGDKEFMDGYIQRVPLLDAQIASDFKSNLLAI